MISLFFNTRKRIGLLNNLLSSIYNTVQSADNIEVFVTVDNDDSESKEFLDSLNFPNLNVRSIEKPSNLHTSINEMAEMASGDFLFVLNDDVIFRTFHWDRKIIDNYMLTKNKELTSISKSSLDKEEGMGYLQSVLEEYPRGFGLAIIKGPFK